LIIVIDTVIVFVLFIAFLFCHFFQS